MYCTPYEGYFICVHLTGTDPRLPEDVAVFVVWRRDEVLPRVEMIMAGLTPPEGGHVEIAVDFG
jgi:hypothetical protein